MKTRTRPIKYSELDPEELKRFHETYLEMNPSSRNFGEVMVKADGEENS